MRISPTPIVYFDTLSGNEVYIKRDDLIPFSFGGNKVRIAEEVFREAEGRGARTVISYGSPSSNLNRVVAHMAAVRGLSCILIIKKEGGRTASLPFNELLMRSSGAESVYAEPDRVRETVAEVLGRSRAAGENPYYVYGDETGHGGEEVLMRAYRSVYAEILQQEKELGIRFENIVLPAGTGATAAGLLSACGTERRIIGISVARKAETLRHILTEDFGIPGAALALPGEPDAEKKHLLTDAYTGSGYGACSPELKRFLEETLRARGLPLDPVYTGKAFYGLTEELKKGAVRGNTLFLHTGGLPLVFDFLKLCARGISVL